jgi:hypothetical protein
MGSIITKDNINTEVRRSLRPYKKRDITVRFVPNILADEGRELKSFPYNRHFTIHKYLQKSGFEFKDMRISVNGRKIEDLNKRLTIGDEIVIAPEIRDPITGAIGAFISWFGSLSTLAQIGFVVGAAAVGYSIYQAISAQQIKFPTYNTSGDGLDEGSTYAWDGVRTTAEVGKPVPVIYGERVIGGNVLNEYVSTDGDSNYLHTLLGIGWGEMESITMRRINRNTATNYSGWSLTTRMGTLDQEVIPNFHDSHNLVSIGVELTKDNAYTYTTDGDDVEAFEIHLAVAGLYQQDSSGNILSWDITYKVEYKLHSAGEWTDLGSTTISKRTRNTFKSIYRKDGLTAGQYDIRITRTSDDSSDLDYPITNGDMSLERIDEISCEDEQIFPRVALAAVDALALEQLSGSFPDYELLVKGRKIMTPKVMNGEEDVPWDDYYWDPEEEAYRLLEGDTILTWDGETFTTAYSANPVWCLYDLQTNRLFGAGHYITAADNNIASLIEQSQYCEEKVSDGNGGYQKRFRLDVVIDSQQKALDLIVQLCSIFRAYPFYSDKGQVRLIVEKPETPVQLFCPGNIIENSFSESWGSRREIPNIVNVQFDDEDQNYTTQTIQAWVDDEALTAGKPLNPVTIRYYGVKESYAIRHGRNYALALKYISNTINLKSALGSIVRQCGEVVDIAHDVPQWGFGGTVKGAVYKGDYSAVITYVVNEAVTYEGAEYKCILASLNHLPTDTDYWEVISRTKVLIDRTVTIEEGKSYAIRVDFAKGGYEERTVTDAAGSYTEVNVSEAFSKTPIAYDLYSFGEVDKVVKPGRIMGISRNRDGEIEFEIPEYNEDIYDDSAVVLPTKKYSSLSTDFPNVTDLTLSERVITAKDGTVENAIEVSFSKPDMSSYIVNTFRKVRIYYSDNDGASWIYAGETYGESFVISGNLKIGVGYVIAVVAVGVDGEERIIPASPQEDITLEGKITVPANVSSFSYSWGDLLLLSWIPNTEEDLAGYEIRNVDSDWGVGEPIDTGLTTEEGNQLITEDGNNIVFEPLSENLIYRGVATRKTLYPEGRTVGTYYIKAFNTSGLFSENAVSVTPELSVPTTPDGLGADVMFNTARIYWTDNRPTNLLYYEVWRSETNLWAGEEELVGRVSGKSITLNSRSPRSGTAQSGSNTTLVDNSLIGFGDGYFVGDTIVITEGTGEGLSAEITGFDDETGELTFADIGEALDSTSQYNITDNTWIKVRGVDQYGAGVFSSALEINYENLTEEMFGDNVITARKIYVACLSALSANLGCVTAGVIQGATMQTAAGGARTVFSGTEFRSYDGDGNVMFEVKDGNVVAKTMTLQDPACCCCYSYLSAGQWYFHDELGNATPYVKRLCAGEATTGDTVCLPGWKVQPYIQIGIKDLAAYDPNYSVNCQKWCVYYNNLCCYENSPSDYGWSFEVHATLYKASGEYEEAVKDVALDTNVYTHSDACWSRVRNRFLLWCFNCESSSCYGYGVLCYRIKFRCYEEGCAWVCCDYSYTQPHDSSVALKTCYDICQNICFPGTGCWEIQLNCLSLTWCLSALSGVVNCCCCRTINDCNTVLQVYRSMGGGTYEEHTCCDYVYLTGDNPSNVYCAYVCFCDCTRFYAHQFNYYFFTRHCFCLTFGQCLIENRSLCFYTGPVPATMCEAVYGCNLCIDLATDYNYTCICRWSCLFFCTAPRISGTWCFGPSNCTYGMYLIQCYCTVPSCCACEYERQWSLKDYSEQQTILDPSGVLNYLAISYS